MNYTIQAPVAERPVALPPAIMRSVTCGQSYSAWRWLRPSASAGPPLFWYTANIWHGCGDQPDCAALCGVVRAGCAIEHRDGQVRKDNNGAEFSQQEPRVRCDTARSAFLGIRQRNGGCILRPRGCAETGSARHAVR